MGPVSVADLPTQPVVVWHLAQRQADRQLMRDSDEPTTQPDWAIKHDPLAQCFCGCPFTLHGVGEGYEFRLSPCQLCGQCSYFQSFVESAWMESVFIDDVEMAAWRDVDNLARGRAYLVDAATLSKDDIKQAHRDRSARERREWAGSVNSTETPASQAFTEDDIRSAFG